MTHPNAEVIRKGFDAFITGDMVVARSIFAPDVVWHVQGHGRLSGAFHGFDAIAKWGGQLMELSAGTFREELVSIEGFDHWAIQVANFSAERNGRSFKDQSVNVYRMVDGRVAECWVYFSDVAGFDDFSA